MNDEALKKAYQALNQEEPIGSPPELDAAILAEAHKAVQAKPQAVVAPNSARSHLTLRWSAPIASAALVVLSVTVFIIMPELESEQFRPQAVQSYKQDKQAADEREPPAASLDVEIEEQGLFAAPASMPVKPERIQAEARAEASMKKAKAPTVQSRSVAKLEEKVMKQPRQTPLGFSSMADQANRLASGAEAASVAKESRRVVMDDIQAAELDAVEQEISVITPERWSKNILKLIEQGDWTQAEKQYQAFAKHYPEHEFNKEYARLKQN